GGSAKLTTVSLPKVTSIGIGAFYNCAKLTAVSLPEATEIRDSAFSKCTNLATVSLPKVTKISTQAFIGCTNLTEVSLPEVTEIGGAAFNSCVSLTTVSLPKVTSIGDNAFYSSALATLKIAAAPPTIGTNAVSNTPKTNPLVLLAEDGSELTGSALTDAQDLYKAASDGNTTDGLWYGWTIAAPATAPTIAAVAAQPAVMTGADLYASLTAPAVTENGFPVTARGWQSSADGSTGWQNVPAGGLARGGVNGYYLRYYVTYDSGTKVVHSPNTVQLTVNRYTPTIALTAAPDSPQSAGTTITLTATLSGGFSGVMSNQDYLNTVPVTFKDGEAILGTAVITAATGTATYSFTPASGSHTFTAVFPGETDYNTVATSDAVSYVVSAAPVTDYGIWVGTTKVTIANASNVLGDSGTPTVSYNLATNTLTLNGATITSAVAAGTGEGQNGDQKMTGGIFKQSGDLNIVLHGSNTISISAAASNYLFGIYTGGNLSITGTAADSLSIHNTLTTTWQQAGIYGYGGVTIDGCTVTATAGRSPDTAGILAKQGILSIKNATVTANGGSTPAEGVTRGVELNRVGSLSIENSTVTANGVNGTYGYGIITPNSTVTVTISGSTITARGDTQALAFTGSTLTLTGLTAIATSNITGTGTATVTLGDSVYGFQSNYKYVKLTPASGVTIGTLSVPASFTAGSSYAPSSFDGYKPTVTATGGAAITAQGWQKSVSAIGGADNWNNWTQGELTPTITSTYKLRYYVTYTVDSASTTVYSNAVTLTVADPNTAAVAAAKAALSDGTVTVAIGADQTAKTAAVQAYVNGLLTGDAAGVTAMVTYNSGTGKYDVALTKGSANDTKSLSMSVNESSDPNIAAVAAAKTAAENANYADMTQAEAPNANAINAALKAAADAAVGNNGVTVTVNQISYSAPIAGTSANTDGTDGTYTFTVTVTKDGQSAKTEQKTITVTATALPTYNVGGSVTDSANAPLAGASVKLMLGRTQVGAPATTDGSGAFTISGIPNGTYNLVVSKDGIVVTSIITVSNAHYAAGTIKLPAGKTNSVVEVKDNTPAIVVGNLDTQFGTTATADDKGVTASDQTVVTGGGSVEIKLIAEEKTQSGASNGAAITAAATANGNTVGIYLDLSVVKTVTANGSSPIETTLTELPSLIEVRIPLDAALQGRSGYVVYRYHGSAVDTITTAANADGEKIELADSGATIILTVKKFSTYAVGYTPAATGPTGGTGGSVASGAITTGKSDNGSITIGADKKSAVITPDDGYVIADVLVDGKSVGATEKYTFADSSAHKISAVFVLESALPYYLQNGERLYIGFSVITGKLYKYLAPAGVSVLFADNSKSFTDNTIAWAKPGIDFVTERELFLGTGTNSFSPNASMTRGMFVAVIGRLYERSYGSVSGIVTFSDVAQDAYYAKYVAWASENGIIKGVGENKFAPGRKITREQMAAILLNFAVYLQTAEVGDGALRYPDSAELSAWAVDGAKFCQKTQIIMGRADGSFAPKDNATRAEVAAVIMRFIKTIVD
ncbi:leucine-rich repeat protein, partial [uncultured Oscillibacter sp.]|uniref:leucine-rich repeat protein n=1 Tax=uncultured Oscillibacter sp. TaxID=876091 RepID=UPI0025DA5BF3